MNLIIEKDLNYQQDSGIFFIFLCQCLIPELYIHIISSINMDQVLQWNKYFKQTHSWNLGDYSPNAYNLINQGALSLIVKEYKDYYIISIKNNQIVPGTTAKLYDLCCEINYGNLSLPPYPIFDDSFKWALDKIKPLYLQWVEDMIAGED